MKQKEENLVPCGWVRTIIGEIQIDHSKGIVPKKNPKELFELYSVPAFNSGNPETLKGEAIGSNKQTVEEKTVLLCKINPRINRVWIVGNHTKHPKIASTEWIPFFPNKYIEPKFLCYYMQRDHFRDYIASRASGVGGSLMRIKPSTIFNYPIPISPLNEQVHIVEEIEKQFTRLDAAVDALERVKANLKRYRSSVLKAACEGRLVPTEAELAQKEGRSYKPADVLLKRILKERLSKWEADQLAQMKAKGKSPKDDHWKEKYKEPMSPDMENLPKLSIGWVRATVDQLSIVVRGASPRPAGSPRYFGGSIPWITVGSLTADETPYLRQVASTLTIEGKNASRFIEVDTLLLTNSGATLGVPKITLIGGCINDGVAALLSVNNPLKLYLYYFLKGQTDKLRGLNQGAAQPNLNTSIIKAVIVPLPPFNEQERIVAEIEKRMSVIEELETLLGNNLKKAERLRQSILKRAFEGKLVPQDPYDEPASILLDRIREDRVKAENETKPKAKIKRQKQKVK